MSQIQTVKQFLSAAADEIVEAVEKMIAGYEEEMFQSKREISRQRKMLDALLQPEIRLTITSEEAQLNLSVWEEDFLTEQQQEWNSSPRQKNPESLQTERRHKEPLSSSHDRRPEDDTMHDTFTQCVKNEHEIFKEEEEEPLPVISAEQMPVEADEEAPSPGLCEAEMRDEDENWMLSESFNCHHNMTRHLRIHTGERPYSCNTCGKCFNDYSTLKQHVCTHLKVDVEVDVVIDEGDGNGEMEASTMQTSKKQLLQNICKVCGKEFYYMASLVNHTKTHTEDLCGVCGAQFESEESLKLHLQTHVNGNVCKVCGKCFHSLANLEVHKRIHTGEKPFSCSVCGKSFTTHQSMIRHMRIHTGEKPYLCNLCGRCFTDHSTLKQHTSTHTGEKPHHCQICGKGFHRKTYLRVHMRSQHM